MKDIHNLRANCLMMYHNRLIMRHDVRYDVPLLTGANIQYIAVTPGFLL